MPAAGLERGRIAGAALARLDPVARIACVAVTRVAIVADEGIRDEVVAWQDVRGEIGMRAITRVEHRDHHARTRGLVPGGRRVDATGGLEVMPLLAVPRVVRGEGVAHQPVRFGVFHVRIAGRDVLGEARGFGQ
jgi:hypothetical protein